MPGRAPTWMVILVLVLGVIAATGGYFWWASPERQIRRALDEIAEAFSHEQTDSQFDTLAAVRALPQHFAVDVSIAMNGAPIVTGRQDVVATVARLRATTPMMHVQFMDAAIDVDGNAARVEVQARVVTRNAAGEETTDEPLVQVTMRKEQDQWVVARADVMRVAEQQP